MLSKSALKILLPIEFWSPHIGTKSENSTEPETTEEPRIKKTPTKTASETGKRCKQIYESYEVIKRKMNVRRDKKNERIQNFHKVK